MAGMPPPVFADRSLAYRAVKSAGAAKLFVHQQMKLAAQPMVHGDHSPIDVADQAIAENNVGNFPIAADADIG
jgi:hypothetical protein